MADPEAAAAPDPVVHLEPLGVDIPVPRALSLMEAAEAAGWRWPTVCQGTAICTRCWIEVDPADADALSPMRPDEREALDRVRWRGDPVTGERLACQVHVRRDVTVFKRYVTRRADADT